MSDVASPSVVSMLAWWDPKDRTVILDSGPIVPGLLCVDGGVNRVRHAGRASV